MWLSLQLQTDITKSNGAEISFGRLHTRIQQSAWRRGAIESRGKITLTLLSGEERRRGEQDTQTRTEEQGEGAENLCSFLQRSCGHEAEMIACANGIPLSLTQTFLPAAVDPVTRQERTWSPTCVIVNYHVTANWQVLRRSHPAAV